MNLADQTKAEGAAPRARFSPLKMVARALGALQPTATERGADTEAADPAPAARLPPIMGDLPRIETPAVEAAGDDFLAIVNAMLAADEAPEGAAAFDLVALVGEAHEVFAPVAQRQGAVLALAVTPRAEGRYHGDAPRVRQAVLNLVSGALKATTEDVLLLNIDRVDGDLCLHVEGAGIAAAMARLLADPTRPPSRRPAAQRLALAHTAALALGGAVRALAGEGVEMRLPLQRLADAPPLAAPTQDIVAPAAPALPTFGPGLGVIVAEEDPAHRQALRTLLTDMGLDVVAVEEGVEVVAEWRQQGWDALLIDIDGDAICGRHIIRSIRSAEAKVGWPRTPILALSGQARDLGEDFVALIDGVVTKPIRPAALHQAVARALTADRAGAGTAVAAA